MAKIAAAATFPVRYDNAVLFQAPETRTVSRIRPVDPVLIAVLTGEFQADAVVGQGDWTLRAGPGDVVYWPGDLERIEQNDTAERFKCMAFLFRWTTPPPELPRKVHDHHGLIRALGEALIAVKDSSSSHRTAMRNSYLTAMVAEYLRLATALGEGLEAKITRYVQEHMREPISLDDLAVHVGLSRYHFCHKYKALTGRTPLHDVRRAKAEHAAGCLRSGIAGLKGAAAHVGLDDPLQLSRWLHKYVGIPVRDLRK